MADIVATEALVSRIHASNDEVFTMITGVAVNAGEVVYVVTSTGQLALADGSAAGTAMGAGIALNSAQIGDPVAVLKRGKVAGFTLAGDWWSKVYISDTAGSLADAAGTKGGVVGLVVPSSDPTPAKQLYVDFPWITIVS